MLDKAQKFHSNAFIHSSEQNVFIPSPPEEFKNLYTLLRSWLHKGIFKINYHYTQSQMENNTNIYMPYK